MLSSAVQKILDNYRHEIPAIREKLGRLLSGGAVGGSGRLVISAVDQGFEHGPIVSFGKNPSSYDPLYHFRIAAETQLSALAGPVGFLQAGVESVLGQLPLILKINSSNKLVKLPNPDQGVTSSVDEAIRLGCIGVGFTIYPGSNASLNQLEELSVIAEEARSKGLLVIVWSYPRGNLSPSGETSLDVVSYGAHMACLMGAHIVKVKIPTNHIEKEKSKEGLQTFDGDLNDLSARIRFVKEASFSNRRLVIFSGGDSKDTPDLLTEVQAIHEGGGDGSIIGRNIFQRPEEEAKELIKNIVRIYKN